MEHYNPQEIEKKWQKKWLDEKVFRANDDSSKPKYYQLETFPYPSGAGLHVGHPKGYIAEDIHARYMRMRGHEVLYTMGWDAFGLPTENYAIKVNKTPQAITIENTDNFRRQVRMFGFSYDWDREINTSSPEYYKWTQWLFIQLFKKGLAYRAKAKVNWCPKDQTIIANEQVINGTCERCGSVIEERFMEQWMLRITDYADRLLDGLKGLDWTPATIKRQEDWIGKSEGAELTFEITSDASNSASDAPKNNYVLLHGFSGAPDEIFFPWLSKELSDHKLSFVAPQLPNTKTPTEEEQVNYVLQNCVFDENTILLGHSLGSVVALKVLEKLEHPIAGVVLVAGFLEPKFKDHDRNFVSTFDWNFDFEKIKANARNITIVSTTNDSAVPIEQGRLLHEKLGGVLKEVNANADHFCGDVEPEILKALIPSITVFTTRPDTLFGATYVVLAPEHALIEQLKSSIANWDEVAAYVASASHKTDLMRQESTKEKTGVELRGVRAINPATKEEVSIWVADYVLGSYGTGAIMAVPAHDERDFAFAKKFNLPIKKVLESSNDDELFTGHGVLINSGQFTGRDSESAKWDIVALAGGVKKTQYKLRDWSVSRQRYWGAPIPMINCEACQANGVPDGIIPVPEKDLPVILPELENYRPQGVAPLASDAAFMKVTCPQCGGEAQRDPETFDTFVDSSWYYLRYPDPHNADAIFDQTKTKHWLPVDLYIIGAEHTVLHLLYSRFITKFLHDQGMLQFDEPFLKLRHQGLIRGNDGQKMSKSKGNVVNPDELIAEFGADTLRLYEMFMGPFEDGAPWDPKGILGVNRFLGRFWKYAGTAIEGAVTTPGLPSASATLHRTIKKVGEDVASLKFNTAISSLMILLNELETAAPLQPSEFKMVIKLLHPFAPHMAQELWSLMGETTYLDFEPWPQYDQKLIIKETITLVFQVNGKVRASVSVPAGITEDEAKSMAAADEKVITALAGQTPKRVIYVEKKLVNIVI